MSNLNIVYGPPCCGKTKYVKDNKFDEDIVINLDLLKSAITFKEIGAQVDNNTLNLILKIKEQILSNKIPGKNYWLITTKLEDEMYNFTNINLITIQTTKQQVFEIIDNNPKINNKDYWKQVVSNWFLINKSEVT